MLSSSHRLHSWKASHRVNKNLSTHAHARTTQSSSSSSSSSSMASSSAGDAAASSNLDRDWIHKPQARQVIASAMAEVVGNAQMDLLPTIDNSRLIGIYSKDPNVEVARYAVLQRAVARHGVTDAQLTEAWFKGGNAFEEAILGIPEVAETLHGEYLKRRGGLPGQAISVLPGDPDIDEHLPPIPGPPIPNSGDRSKDIMLSLIRLLRAEGNEERARQLEDNHRGVQQMLGLMRPI